MVLLHSISNPSASPIFIPRLDPAKRHLCQRGIIPHAAIIGLQSRDTVETHIGRRFRVSQPTLAEYLTLRTRRVTPVRRFAFPLTLLILPPDTTRSTPLTRLCSPPSSTYTRPPHHHRRSRSSRPAPGTARSPSTSRAPSRASTPPHLLPRPHLLLSLIQYLPHRSASLHPPTAAPSSTPSTPPTKTPTSHNTSFTASERDSTTHTSTSTLARSRRCWRFRR